MAMSRSRRRRRGRRRSIEQARRLDLVPAVLAVLTVVGAGLIAGAASNLGVLAVAGALIAASTFALAVSGPRQGHFGLLAAIIILFVVALVSGSPSLVTAAPHLAIWAAAAAAWSSGYVAARQRLTDTVWSLLTWCWTAVTAYWLFARFGSSEANGPGAELLPTPDAATSAVIFSLGALIGSSRVLHVYKSGEADGLPFSNAADRLLREGLGGMLLLGFSLTTLIAIGNITGLLAALSILSGHAAWDLRATLQRERSRVRRNLLGIAGPLAALAFAGTAGAMAYLQDESVAPGTPGASEQSRLQRVDVYSGAWSEAPLTGQGVGSIDAVRDRAMTLDTYATLSPPGDAQNLILRQLVETGVVGVIAFLGLFAFACGRLTAGMRRMTGARTLPRLAVSACGLCLMHGLLHSSLSIAVVIWTVTLLMGLAAGVLDLSTTNRRDEEE